MHSPSVLSPLLGLLLVTVVPSLLFTPLLALVLMPLLSSLQQLLCNWLEKRQSKLRKPTEYVILHHSKMHNRDVSIGSAETSSTLCSDSDHDKSCDLQVDESRHHTTNSIKSQRGRANERESFLTIRTVDSEIVHIRSSLLMSSSEFDLRDNDDDDFRCSNKTTKVRNDNSTRDNGSHSHTDDSTRLRIRTSNISWDQHEDSIKGRTTPLWGHENDATPGFRKTRILLNNAPHDSDDDSDTHSDNHDAAIIVRKQLSDSCLNGRTTPVNQRGYTNNRLLSFRNRKSRTVPNNNMTYDNNDGGSDDNHDATILKKRRSDISPESSSIKGRNSRTSSIKKNYEIDCHDNNNNSDDDRPRQQPSRHEDSRKVVSFDSNSPKVYADRFDRQARNFLCYNKREYRSFEKDIQMNLYKLIRSEKIGRHPWNLDSNRFCTRGLEKQIAEKGGRRLSFPACQMLLVKPSSWTASAHEKILEEFNELKEQKVTGHRHRSSRRRRGIFSSSLLFSSFTRGMVKNERLDPDEEMRSISMELSQSDRTMARKRALRDHAQANGIMHMSL